jgi:hypothetical protein
MHLRGMFTAFQLNHHFFNVSPATLEEMAVEMLKQLESTGRNHSKDGLVENAVTLKVKIHAEALAILMKQDKWHSLFKEPKKRKSKEEG